MPTRVDHPARLESSAGPPSSRFRSTWCGSRPESSPRDADAAG